MIELSCMLRSPHSPSSIILLCSISPSSSSTVMGTPRPFHFSISARANPSMLLMPTTKNPRSSRSTSNTSHQSPSTSLTPTSRDAR
ncbi:hypothetical protein BDQ94DRAFT_83151 [Aspergillus welwitschiae]|uniref:Uncharacterized protein n=1 Tax=Aspergillus welwitschiae TaxID=1341132 RepID=A0A3F3PRA3_9EURO|nr:uncharacterized protein BO96DRAFT_240410 [Aspergillus niger CBS 101883]XP_026622489.1 hypothetical protein BDQ94DRAFT_83151 [Aspergillus welwitschiae]PYH58416.1 hypothetical protein BO96DRAFT_240410 [Aspergillus niger CBS 101883]RDH29467.1 hypothetical protein BDQ94DRAFT_83151 [Aspergillus welwitschiae]